MVLKMQIIPQRSVSTRGALRIPLVGYYITQLQTLSSDGLQLSGGQQWYHLDHYLQAREQHYGSRYGSEMSCAPKTTGDQMWSLN